MAREGARVLGLEVKEVARVVAMVLGRGKVVEEDKVGVRGMLPSPGGGQGSLRSEQVWNQSPSQ